MNTKRTMLLLLGMLLTLGLAACDGSTDDAAGKTEESSNTSEPDYMQIASDAPRETQTVPLADDGLSVSIELPEHYDLWKQRGNGQRWSYVNKDFVDEGDPVFSELEVPFIELATVHAVSVEEAAADDVDDVEGEVLRNEAAGDAWVLAWVEADDDEQELTMRVYTGIGDEIVSCEGRQDLDKAAREDAMALIESICTSVRSSDS